MKKIVQSKFYSLLSTKWGMLVLVVGFFFLFNSLLQLLILLVEPPQASPIVVREIVTQQQNITIISNPNGLCVPEIDLVYTWVNGSDPRHIAALRETKRILKGEIFRPCNSTEKPEVDNCTRDEETASRFEDNEELRYSLRSVEQFAPWVRHIYLVTNGQVPYWLNLTHPKLTVVPHDQIFVNKSHLPTFSSPAIETHLHRIPGLADKFLYFNDDTMLGNQVWPDDFYTMSGGQKVFLAWPVPNCNEGCPPTWVRDGVCDLPCNVSDCDWDGGDCLNATATQSGSNWWNGRGSNTAKQNANTNYCAVGCPDSWIGDKYCDRNCKVLECGFDAGDCDVEDIFSKMHGANIYPDTQFIEIPAGVPAVYFNLTIAHDKKITDGSHDNAVLVRTATISQKHKLMTLTFHRNVTRQTVGISISVENEGQTIDYAFNVSAETYAPESNLNVTTANDTSSDNIASSLNTTTSLNTTDTSSSSNNNNNNTTIEPSPQPAQPVLEPPTAIPTESVQVSDTGGEPQDSVATQPEEPAPAEPAPAVAPLPSDEEVSGTARKLLSILIEGESEPEQSVTSRKLFGLNSLDAFSRSIQIRDGLESSDSRLLENVLDYEQLRDLAQEFSDSFDANFFLASEEDKHEEGEHTAAEMQRYQKWVEDSIRQKYASMVRQHEAQAAKKTVKPPHDNTDTHEMDQPFPWEFPTRYTPDAGRRLLDMYGDSLKWVNRLLNEEFGSSSRKVPAHMPHFIDRKIVEQMQEKWAQHFDATSSHQLRDSHDMQFAFSYFYYMIHQREEFNLTNVWNQFLDMDHDGKLNDNELRTLAVHLRGTPVPAGFIPKLKLTLLNCTNAPIPDYYIEEALKYTPTPTRGSNDTAAESPSRGNQTTATDSSSAPAVPQASPQNSGTPQNSENPDSTLNSLSPSANADNSENPQNSASPQTSETNRIPAFGRRGRRLQSLPSMMPEHAPITMEALLHENCASLYIDIQKHFGKKLKNKHQITDTEEVAFLMVNNNASTTLKSLDGIRERRQKFICLNDNMNHTDPGVKEVLGVIKDFYDSLYPLPSSFELPPGVENPFLHLDEYETAESSKEAKLAPPPAKRRELSTRVPKKEPEPDIILYGLAGVTFLSVACFLLYVCSGFFAASRDRRTKERRFLKVVNA